MIRISFGSEGPKPSIPRWAWIFKEFFSAKIFWIAVALATLTTAFLTFKAEAGITNIGPDNICSVLLKAEGCNWSVIRSLVFRVTVMVNDQGQSSWVLSRGHTQLGSGPLPAEFGVVLEDDLVHGIGFLNLIRYAKGDPVIQAKMLEIAHLPTGAAFLDNLYGVRITDETGSSLGTTLIGKARISIAQ